MSPGLHPDRSGTERRQSRAIGGARVIVLTIACKRRTRRRTEGRTMLRIVLALSTAMIVLIAPIARGADIGQVKVSKGTVTIERSGQSLAADAGTRLQTAD